jgi:YD repeat-containing protein
VTDPGGSQITLGCDNNNNRTSITYPNNVLTVTQGYDTSQRLTSIVGKNGGGTTLTSFSYSYTNPATGNDTALRYSVTDNVGDTVTAYSYDVLNRLGEAQTKLGGTVTADDQYTYDGNGNR